MNIHHAHLPCLSIKVKIFPVASGSARGPPYPDTMQSNFNGSNTFGIITEEVRANECLSQRLCRDISL